MKIRILMAVAIIAFSLTSCKKFLAEQPYSFLTPTNFYKNQGDAVAALNGVFSTMQPQTFYQRTVYTVSDNASDLMYAAPGSSTDRNSLTNHTFAAVNGEIANWYINDYKMIKNANDVIKYVPPISMDAVEKANIIGNARFLRGLGYFNLLTAFGQVPLITEPVTATDPNLYPKKLLLQHFMTRLLPIFNLRKPIAM